MNEFYISFIIVNIREGGIMQNEITAIFADRLQDLIANSGKTIKELAKEIGVAEGSLSKYQNDGAEAGIVALHKIAKYFGVSADYLLNLHDIPSVDKDIQAISKLTGLTVKAIEKLKDDFTDMVTCQEIINTLLESKLFDTLWSYCVDAALTHSYLVESSQATPDNSIDVVSDIPIYVPNMSSKHVWAPAYDIADYYKRATADVFEDIMDEVVSNPVILQRLTNMNITAFAQENQD